MGREIRRVPTDWQHPKRANGNDIPLFDEYEKAVAEWDEEKDQWKKGFVHDWSKHPERVFKPKDETNTGPYEEYAGERPDAEDYMLVGCPPESRTHLMMYETCSEGTPISPAFATPEELAHWLADNGASAFGGMTADYESWLATCQKGSAIGAVFTPETGLVSGVEGEFLLDQRKEG
jgi:hypothetical protein